jgi:capsular polysaccharide biosynthesis protein
VEPYRERIEDFIRQAWASWRSQLRFEGNRVFRVLVITVVLAAVGVTLSGLQQTPTYEASAQVWVDQRRHMQASPDQQTNWTGSGEEIHPLPPPGQLQTIILAMIQAIDSRPVAEEAIGRLELENTLSPAELLDNLTIEQVESTSFIVLTYQGSDPVEATKIVNTVAEVSSEFISEDSQLTANVYEEAMVPDSPVSPDPLRNGLLTLVIGLMLCAGTALALPAVRARVAGTLGERPTRQGVGASLAGVLRRQRRDRSIVERVKEKKLLLALGRYGKLTAVEAALETSLSVEEANRILEELAFAGHLEVTVEHGRLLYSFWGHEAP